MVPSATPASSVVRFCRGATNSGHVAGPSSRCLPSDMHNGCLNQARAILQPVGRVWGKLSSTAHESRFGKAFGH
jgi:hypothetical protein